MKVRAGEVTVADTRLAIILVDLKYIGSAGDRIIELAQPFFPHVGIMLVAIDDNGFEARAYFHTATFLALLQLEEIDFVEIDLDTPPVPDEELPF